MKKENENKNKIIGISIGMLIVLLLVISSTYAYWQITRSQTDPNKLIAACLDFNVDFPIGISEDNAWPISNAEGLSQEGYTFTVTNNCEEDVSYVVGLESVDSDKITNYLNDESIALAFDKEYLGTYGSLTNLEGPTTDARGSKELRTSTVKGKSDVVGENVNTHNLKLWIDAASDVSEQGRGFAAKLFITGGQGVENDNPSKLTADSCFEMDGNEIIGYDESCGESVVIPSTVNGVAVKTIDSYAFKQVTTTYNYDYGIVLENSQPVAGIVYNMDEFNNLMAWAEKNGFQDMKFYTEEPELKDGQIIQYCEDPIDGQMPVCKNTDGIILKTEESKLAIKSLDLSHAYNLEEIESYAFSNISNRQELEENELNVETGLTELVFADTDKELILGQGVFVGLDVEELITYTNLVMPAEHIKNENLDGGIFGYVTPFYVSNIENLNILPSGKNNNLYTATYEGGLTDVNKEECGIYLVINVNRLTIGEGITEIPALMFFNMRDDYGSINELVLPSSLKNINDFSFTGADNIKNLTLPDNVEHIGDNAFAAAGIETIKMSKSLKTIGENGFISNDIKEIEFYDGLLSIGANSFWNNKNLTSVIIPSTIKEIGDEAFIDAEGPLIFKGRTNLSGITLGKDWKKSTASIQYQD